MGDVVVVLGTVVERDVVVPGGVDVTRYAVV